MSILTEKIICDHLERYVFERIWNDPYKELRTNVKPILLSRDPVCGIYDSRYGQLALPDNISLYYVYAIALESIQGFKLGIQDWIKVSDYCRDSFLDIQIYTADGMWLWREGIYLRPGLVNNSILIAVRRDVFNKCCGSKYNPSNIFFTKYHDSDNVQDVSCDYYYLQNQLQLSNAYMSSTKGNLTFVNGRLSKVNSSRDLTYGDYVEVVYDKNIIATIDIDMSTNNVTYTDKDNVTKTIIHTPKKLNKYMYFISHHTCDSYVLPRTLTDIHTKPNLQGLFVHKCNREDSFSQLTHCDYSIANELVGSVASYIGTENYNLITVIRSHTKKPGMVRDVNYCELLYVHDDDTILDFMTGNGPASFEFWTAKVLEESIYAHAISSKLSIPPTVMTQCLECGIKEFCTKNNTSTICTEYVSKGIKHYVDMLGYYNTISLVCDRTRHYRVENNNKFVVPIPVCMYDYNVTSLQVIAYKNGYKLPDNAISIYAHNGIYDTGNIITQDVIEQEWADGVHRLLAYDTDARCFVMEIDTSIIALQKGDIVAVEVFEHPSTIRVNKILPAYSTSTASLFTQRFSTNYPLTYKNLRSGYVKNIDGSVVNNTMGYNLLNNPGVFDTNTNTLQLDKSLESSTLTMVENIGLYKVYENTNWKLTIDDFSPMSTGKLLLTDEVPVLQDVTYLVFLNGRTLVEGVDFSVVRSTISATIIQTEIVIQNITWLELSNHIEIYAACTTARGQYNSYVSGNKITDIGESPFWFDNMSMLTVDGLIQSDFSSFFGLVFDISAEHRNGSLFSTRTLIPNTIVNILDKYEAVDDKERLIMLRDYFIGRNEDPISRIVIPYSHRVCSIYANAIVKDFLTRSRYILAKDKFSPNLINYVVKEDDETWTPVNHNTVNWVLTKNTYYEKLHGVFRKTEDTTILLGKVYYKQITNTLHTLTPHSFMYPDGLSDELGWEVNNVAVDEKTWLEHLSSNGDSNATQRLRDANELSRSFVYYTKSVNGKYTKVTFEESDIGKAITKDYYHKESGCINYEIYHQMSGTDITDTLYEEAFELTKDTQFIIGKLYYKLRTGSTSHYGPCIPVPDNKYYVYHDSVIMPKVFDFDIIDNEGLFLDQFKEYDWLKQHDVVYKHNQDLRYLDVYPMYHRSLTHDREDYIKLKYLFDTLFNKDNIKHRDVIA